MIRSYTPSDYESAIRLLKANTPHYFHPDEEVDFRNYLAGELDDYYVLLIDQKVVGVAGLNYNHADELAVFAWAMVHPAMHGQGLGRRLVAHRLAHLAASVPHYRVQVRTSQHTYGFYEKMGFTLQNIVKDYWAPDMHLYDMILAI